MIMMTDDTKPARLRVNTPNIPPTRLLAVAIVIEENQQRNDGRYSRGARTLHPEIPLKCQLADTSLRLEEHSDLDSQTHGASQFRQIWHRGWGRGILPLFVALILSHQPEPVNCFGSPQGELKERSFQAAPCGFRQCRTCWSQCQQLGGHQEIYSISHKTCTWFGHALFCCGYISHLLWIHVINLNIFFRVASLALGPQCQWSNPEGYGWNWTVPKYNKSWTMGIICGICLAVNWAWLDENWITCT